MNKDSFFLIAGLIVVGGIFSVANAINPFDITYPIAELGNCASQEECKVYCDNPDNQIVCTDWAAGKGFVDRKESEKLREINELGNTPDSYGPGGCKTPGECDNYCRALEHLDECLNYSVEKGFMSVEESKKIRMQANRKGPGGCDSREECDNFCKNPEHIEECMNFAVEDGNISKEEADFIIQRAKMYGGPDGQKGRGPKKGPQGPKIDETKAKEVLESKGGGPGGCKNMNECAAYCEEFEHGEECMNFAVKNGFMPPDEEQRIRKMMTMTGPGGCKGPRECDEFCGKEENRDECFRFAKESGMMLPEEIQMMEKEMEIVKKLERRGGPGGCKGPQECQSYCSDQTHMEECMNFASQNGMMRKDEAQMRMQEMNQMQMQTQMMNQDRERFMQMPALPGQGGGPPPGFEGFMKPPEGMMPPGEYMSPPGEYPMPPEGFRPPEGYMMPPPGDYQPSSENYPMPSEGNYMPPPGDFSTPPSSGEISPPPPPSSEPSPPSSYNQPTIFGIILGPFLDIFR